MQCPYCGEVRYSKHWKKVQWTNWRPDVHDFNCCKVCSFDGYKADSPSAQAEALERVLQARKFFQRSTANGWYAHLQNFLVCWVASPHGLRKYFSYFGALRRSSDHDPRGFSAGQLSSSSKYQTWSTQKPKYLKTDDYFDPGNWHYKTCLALLWPYANTWNQETCGDIIEALLGLEYLQREYRVEVHSLPLGFIEFLHEWCYSIHSYFTKTAWAEQDIKNLRNIIFGEDFSDA